jgi:hypothetical protein
VEAQKTAAHQHKQPDARTAAAAAAVVAGRKDAAYTAQAQARRQWGPTRRDDRIGRRRWVLEAEAGKSRMRGRALRVRRWGRIGLELGGSHRAGGGIVGKHEGEAGLERKAVRLRRRRGSGAESGVVVRRRWELEQGRKLARRSLCGRCGRSAGRCGLRLLGGLGRCVELVQALLSSDSCRQEHSGFGDGGSPVWNMLGRPAGQDECTAPGAAWEYGMVHG